MQVGRLWEEHAQGSTDFCKAHGGGKRCSWGRGGLSIQRSVALLVTALAQERLVCVLHTLLWCKTVAFMVGALWDLLLLSNFR